MATWQDLYECIVCNNSIDCFIREHHLKPSRLKKLMRSKNLLEALEVRRAAGVLVAYANAGSSAASAVWRLDQLLVGHAAGPETARKAAMAIIKLAQDAKGYIETLVSAAQGEGGEPLPIANSPCEVSPRADCPLPIEQPRPAGSANGGCRGLRSAAEQPRSTTEAEPGAAESSTPLAAGARGEEAAADDLRSEEGVLAMPRNNGRVGDEASPTLQLATAKGEEAAGEAQVTNLCYQEGTGGTPVGLTGKMPVLREETAEEAAEETAEETEQAGRPVPREADPARTFPSVPPRSAAFPSVPQRSATFRPVPKLNRGRAEIMTRKLLHRLGLQDLSSTGVVCLVTGNEKSDSGTIREPRHQEAQVTNLCYQAPCSPAAPGCALPPNPPSPYPLPSRERGEEEAAQVANLCYQEAPEEPAPGRLATLDISQFPPDREALLRIAKAGDNNNDGRGAAKVESPLAFVAQAELVRPGE